MSSRPAVTSSNPVATTTFVPTRSTTFGEMAATTPIVSANGSNRMPAARGVIAKRELEVLGEQEQRSEHGEEDERDRCAGRAEPRVGEEPDVEHRVIGARLPPDEHTSQREPTDERDQDRGIGPAAVGRLDDGVEQRL